MYAARLARRTRDVRRERAPGAQGGGEAGPTYYCR